MKVELKKERIYLCAPSSCVSTIVTIKGDIKIASLIDAIKEAVNHNQILNTCIQIEADGSAYYQTETTKDISILVSNDYWQKIVQEQIKIRFKIENGELIRFFIIPQQESVQLIIINHHIIGDGLSISFLIEDIMKSFSAKELTYKPISSTSIQINKPILSHFIRIMMSRLNRNWSKSETIFHFYDIIRLFNRYWDKRNIKIFSQIIDKNTVQRLYQLSKQNNITINSILLTAFYKVLNSNIDIGISINLRQENYKGMGNYATGITISYEYNGNLSFLGNAVKVHNQVHKKLSNNKKKYFLMQFMNSLSVTLIDSTYFAVFDNYHNKLSQMTANMFGYNDNPQGISITNLTKIPISSHYGTYHLSNYICIPPLVPNLKRVVGISTMEDTMNITMCVEESNLLPKENEFFEATIEILKKLN